MDSLLLQKRWFLLALCFSFLVRYVIKADGTIEGTVTVSVGIPIAETDETFVCATLDLWPSDKCCGWEGASFLTLNLSNTLFFNAVKAFSPLMLRLGGSLQDRMIYQPNKFDMCNLFVRNNSQLYDYTEGCMSLWRWDELNNFFAKTGAKFIFGLNILRGKTIQPDNTATGSWDPTNAASFLLYNREQGYRVHGYELGNELGGYPIGPAIAPDPYAYDMFTLQEVIYEQLDIQPRSMVMAPGGFFDNDWDWLSQFINKTKELGSLDVLTIHNYNLGEANQDLVEKILNVSVLDDGAQVYKGIHNILKSSGTSTVAWVSESGGVFNSGLDGVTNVFVYSFWYLDQLGLSSLYRIKTFCRQSLVGGNYALLNATTFVPNPDYYSALLWHRLMGRKVLAVEFEGTKMIRAYAHCAKESKGITLLLLNIDGNNTVQAQLRFDIYGRMANGGPRVDPYDQRDEYHLTPMDGNILNRTVLLNGKALIVGPSGHIPRLKPVKALKFDPITVAPHSIAFIHMPNVLSPACNSKGKSST